jgi:cellulose biosynthesis protein BcsQ
MLSVFIIEENIEERHRLYESFQDALAARTPATASINEVSLRPIALHEIGYNRTPDVCLIGKQMWMGRGDELAQIKAAYPDAALLAITSSPDDQLQQLEKLMQLGFDDVVNTAMPTSELYTRLHIHSKKKLKTRELGKISAVVAGKGGVGGTTIATALAQQLGNGTQSVVLVDLDFETQDATRFLSARPYLNEHLTLMLEGQRPAGGECAGQCVTELGDLGFSVVAPPAVLSQARLEDDESISVYLTLVKSLAASYDQVVIDTAGVTGKLAQAIYQLADAVIIIAPSDPAGVFATAEKVKRIRYAIGATDKLVFAEVRLSRVGLGSKQLREYLSDVLNIAPHNWAARAIPYCRRMQLWPGSGSGALASASMAFQRSLRELVHRASEVSSLRAESAGKASGRGEKPGKQIGTNSKQLLLNSTIPSEHLAHGMSAAKSQPVMRLIAKKIFNQAMP